MASSRLAVALTTVLVAGTTLIGFLMASGGIETADEAVASRTQTSSGSGAGDSKEQHFLLAAIESIRDEQNDEAVGRALSFIARTQPASPDQRLGSEHGR